VEQGLFGVPGILWESIFKRNISIKNFPESRQKTVVHFGVLIDAQRLFNSVRVRRESEERGREGGVLII
jgi:hypothetical protein